MDIVTWITDHLISGLAIILSLVSLIDRKRVSREKAEAEAERKWRDSVRTHFSHIDYNFRKISLHLTKTDDSYDNGLRFHGDKE